jgi:hypothetical protein
MIFRRHWMVMVMAAGCWVVDLSAQETPTPSETPAPSTTPATPHSRTDRTDDYRADDHGAREQFIGRRFKFSHDSNTGDAAGSDRRAGRDRGGEPAGRSPSADGLGFGVPKAPESAPSFTLPGFYGSSATTYTAGLGRLARPRFRYSVNMSVGYDDNSTDAPTKPGPAQVLLLDPGTPDSVEPVFETRFIRGGGGVLIPTQVVVGARTVKGKPPKFQTIPPLERVASFFTRGSFGLDMQFFSPVPYSPSMRISVSTITSAGRVKNRQTTRVTFL